MSENNNFNENNLSNSHIEEFNKNTNSTSDKGVKRKPKQVCKKCKKSYISKKNTNLKQKANIQIPDKIYRDEFNQDPDQNEEIQNLLEKKNSFDINECATNISVWPDNQINKNNEPIVKRRELSTLKDKNIKEFNVESSRIKLYDMSYCTLNQSDLRENENTPIEKFWKKYNGINGHSSSLSNDKLVETDLERSNIKNDEIITAKSLKKEENNIPAISDNYERTVTDLNNSSSKSNINKASKPAINELMTVSDIKKKTKEDLKILELNSKSGVECIRSRGTLEKKKIPLDEIALHMSLKNDTPSVLGHTESVKEESVVKNSIQNVNIVETSGYIEDTSSLTMPSGVSITKHAQTSNHLIQNQSQHETISNRKANNISQYAPRLGHGKVELLVCDYSREPRICINPKFVCEDINPNIIFNHSCFSIIPSSYDSILEYTTPNVSVKEDSVQTNKSNKKISVSEITKSFEENKNQIIKQVKTDAFQINPFEEYTNDRKKGPDYIENSKTLPKKESKEKLILNETERLMKSDKTPLNLGILTSKNEVQNLKIENLKRIHESKNSQSDISSSASMYLSKDKSNSLNQTENKSYVEIKANDINLSNNYINVHEDSYIDDESCASLKTMENLNTGNFFSKNRTQNSDLKLSREKFSRTETKPSKSIYDSTDNNINMNLDVTNTNLEQETLPVRFGVNLPNSDMSKPLETIKSKYEQMSKSLLTFSEKLEEIEENIKKATESVEKITIYDTTNEIIKKSKQDLKGLRKSCKKIDRLIDLISNESIKYGDYNVLKKGSRFDKNNMIINKDIPLIDNHINVNQKNKSTMVINKDLFMNRINGESNSIEENVEEHSTKDYKTFENLVKELTLPLLEDNDNESKTYKPEIPSRRIIIQEDVSSNKEKNILENQEIQLNKEIEELSKKREETIVNNLDELNRLIGNKIQTTEKDTLKVPSMFLGPKNASKPPSKNTRFLLIGPNELIKPVTNDGLIKRPRNSMIENGLKNMEVLNKKNIKPEKIAETPKGVIFEKKILIPEVKMKKKQSKDKNEGAFTKLSKSFTSLFSGDKKPSKAKKVVKSSPKGKKWKDHESYLELQKQKGKVKDMIKYYDNLDDGDSDTELL